MGSVCIIGHFGGNKEFYDGQTVKTRTIYGALSENGVAVEKVDTYFIKMNPIRFFFSFLLKLENKKFIVLLSSNGRKFLFPILYLMSKCGKQVYHYAIGGRLAREVANSQTVKKYVSSFEANWVESISLEKDLHELGIKNAKFIPNFKNLTPVNLDQVKLDNNLPKHFCIFSRIMPEKGILDAMDAMNAVNNQMGCIAAVLDLYGPIEQNFTKEFNSKLSEYSNCCFYKGIVDSGKSVEILKDYYMLLFPTHWKHEGIPGTIIDAFFSGLPVIARRWQYCDEMIQDGVTGLVYEFDQPEYLKDLVLSAINNSMLVFGMKRNCIEASHKYSQASVIHTIMSELF